MVNEYNNMLHNKIEDIRAILPTQQPALLSQMFLPQFFAKAPISDLERIENAVAVDIVASAFDFATHRVKGKPKIRIFSQGEYKNTKNAHRQIIQCINDDMPFLVDSLTTELSRQGYNIYTTLHPMLHVIRKEDGLLESILPEEEAHQLRGSAAGNHVVKESFIHFEISPLPEGTSKESLIHDLEHILHNVMLTVTDWPAMMRKARDVKDNITTVASRFEASEVQEIMDLVDWLMDKNFVFLGYREHDFTTEDGHQRLAVVDGSPLGIFKGEGGAVQHRGHASLNVEECRFFQESALVEITKSDHKSIIHRSVPMDYIGFKRFDALGNVIGESRFLGLFTSVVYYQSALSIPFIRRKINSTLNQANFDPASHNGKSLRAILEFFPRDELFQISDNDLFLCSQGIMSLEAQPDVRIFLRRDPYERFVSALIYAPRDRFSTYVRLQIEKLMESALHGKVTGYNTQISDAPLARLHLIIKTNPGSIPNANIRIIEDSIRRLTSFWNDALREQMLEIHGEQQGELDFRVFRDAFPKNYCNYYHAREAIEDIRRIKDLDAGVDPSVRVMIEENLGVGRFRLKMFTTNRQAALSDMLPILENMGCRVLDVHPFGITPNWERDDAVILKDFALSVSGETIKPLAECAQMFEQTLLEVWNNKAENDGYNALVLYAGLSCRQITLLRAYGKYIKQVGITYGDHYVAQALCNHPAITALLVAMFETRFGLGENAERDIQVAAIRKEIDTALSMVKNLAEDRIIRRFADTMLATLRTNYFQKDVNGQAKTYISFKLDSKNVPELPLPKPHAEIFVYSTRTEGIHLRGGKVARGGLRWSDRHEDFRTEVLGLVKAQMVKNAVIVPVGSKGGFIVKNSPITGGRDAVMAEGIACYQQFLMGLLDITDNINGDAIIPPVNVFRHDGDDPYLVVAADKGTATFSDIANGVSKDYGFWLGDAFASGGSVGYDHKKMGVTARGGWVCVQRHFREMGRDTQTADFTVAGIGDMSGDVFGNGMLLSQHIKLVAAFNHMHIFFDPNPNAAASFAERERLFNLPRSTWMDYDAKLISQGGGIFERNAKTIPLSKEVQAVLGVQVSEASPDEVMKMILKAPVDLLWNGGIGTYVKAVSETNEDVGDKSNDNLRINGEDLRCKVIGEGGNLGFTQRGRIEYALKGGRINTDSIDNSAGVDCSDHEVNIKIAFTNAMQKDRLTLEDRDVILASMTEEVGDLVLRDNQLQTQAITIAQQQGVSLLEQQAQMMGALERESRLNRNVEYLPNDKAIAALRAERRGLTRPELSILLSYAKMSVYDELLASDLPNDDYFIDDLLHYFPSAMREAYRDDIITHRLRRELIATIITNSIINRAGMTFFHSIAEDTGLRGCDIARAYTVARDTFGLRDYWRAIEALDGKIPATAQGALFLEVTQFIQRVTVWMLRNVPQPMNIRATLEQFKVGVGAFAACFASIASETVLAAYEQKVKRFTELGVPQDLAEHVARLDAMSAACDVVQAASTTGHPVEAVGKLYYNVGAHLELGWLQTAVTETLVDSHWDRLAVQNTISDLYDEQRRLTLAVITSLCNTTMCETSVATWAEQNAQSIARYQKLVHDIKATEARDLSMFFVALKQVRSINALPTAKAA